MTSAFRLTRHENALFGSHVHTNCLLHRSLAPLNGSSVNWARFCVPGTGVFSLALTRLSSLTSAQAQTLSPVSQVAPLGSQPFLKKLTTGRYHRGRARVIVENLGVAPVAVDQAPPVQHRTGLGVDHVRVDLTVRGLRVGVPGKTCA